MDTDTDLPKVPASWRDYLSSMRESFGVYRWAWRELLSAESRRYAKRMVAFLATSKSLALVFPWIVGMVFDGLIARETGTVLWGLGGAAVALLIGQFLQFKEATYREYALGTDMGALDHRLNELFFSKSLGQHLRSSDVLSAANIEKGRARVLEVEHLLLFEGVETVVLLLITYGFLWALSPIAGFVTTILFVIYIVWSLFLNYRVETVCVPIDAEFRALNRHRVERWERIERVKTCGKEREETDHMTSWFGRALAADRRFWLWYIAQVNVRGLLNIVALIGVLGYGALCVSQGDWQIGMLYPLLSWMRVVTDTIGRLGHLEHRLNWNMPSVRALREALTVPPEVVDVPAPAPAPRGEPIAVAVEGLSHSYAGDERRGARRPPRPVLANVDLTIGAGEVVALLGKSGSGKTTLMRLLLRGMDPEQGRIRVNGRDLRELELAAWLSSIGYIAQHPAVLDGTVRSNLLYGLSPEERVRVTDDELWALMRDLQIDFGDRLADGLETRVGRSGLKLSGGEAQRLMIGAAAVKRPRFMVIDEATSSLDSTTERAVQTGLAKVLAGGVSGLVIAHRLSTVRDLCDKFVVLRRTDELTNGDPQIEAVGRSFEELAERSPTFRQLATDQGIVLAS